MTGSKVTETNYSHHDPEFAQDPYRVFSEVRKTCPLGHSEQLGGFYFPTTYEGVKRVFSEYQTFSSAEGAGLPPQVVKFFPVDLDPPVHTRWRRVLNRFFTQEAAEADRARIQGIADKLVSAFAARGSADFVNELTRPFLAMTTLPVVGVPDKDRPMLSEKLLWMVHNRLFDFEGWVKCYGEIEAYLTGLMAERRTQPARNDLLQCLVDEEFDGRRLTDFEGYQVLILTLFGALDSTSSAMSGALLHLGQHPEDRARLLSGEVPWSVAIEEFLRITTPIQALRRTVTVDETALDGGVVKKGDFVLALNGAANRDPAKFPEPDRCIISRDAREHMSFGSGAHVCIGRHYARVMIEVCLKTVLNRVGDYELLDGFVPDYTSSEARALKALPVSFTPG